MKPSMKYNILSLIKDKLDKHPQGSYVYSKPWYYNNMHNRIDVTIGDGVYIVIFETYGEYPLAICQEIIDDHNGNLLIGMSFNDYFTLIQSNEPLHTSRHR